MARDIPLRRSLLARLLAVSVLVSVGSIAATTWLAAQTTSGALRQEQGQVLADDARVYDRLLGVGAGAPEWRGADEAVRELSRRTGRRIALTTQDRKVIADSAAPAKHTPLPPNASAVLDPLAVDTTLTPGRSGEDTAADRIDPRAVGPYRLTRAERAGLKAAADRSAACLTEIGMTPEVVTAPGGRPSVRVGGDPTAVTRMRCGDPLLDVPTETERKALKKLDAVAGACMKRSGLQHIPVGLDLSGRSGPKPVGAVPTYAAYVLPVDPVPGDPTASGAPETPGAPEVSEPPRTPDPTEGSGTERDGAEPATTPDPFAARSFDDAAREACVDSARREQLGPYVSPPALLFITSQDGSRGEPGFSLSRDNTARLAGLAAAVLAVTVAVTAFAATRLTRPLRALTTATRRMKAGEPGDPVPATATRSAGEISQLAAAFNDMAAHRKALEEQRKAMVSDVAHELRTPLSNIRGWLEAAEDGVVETDPELVTSLLEEALLLQHIVDDLQDLAAADAGTLRLHKEPVRAADIAEQVAAAHQARADAAGVKLRATAFGDPWLTADPLRLRQAVGNLVSNAVRHTPEGGSVRVTCRGTADAVLIEVADTGTGIEAADLPHVFDRFWRADKSRTRATGGSGLGLSIVRKLVEAHDGTVTAESVPGKGSQFTVRLPAG
ncbi:HAMP domain-containing sensor histidine kinase [Streptomyces sp. NPDC050703]|uniref:HAMP domain-containing sensor histidine kinase n=1 Tax=Streptomyces sp. NPDC050703 TaxID=3157218 RepID=UPI003445D303